MLCKSCVHTRTQAHIHTILNSLNITAMTVRLSKRRSYCLKYRPGTRQRMVTQIFSLLLLIHTRAHTHARTHTHIHTHTQTYIVSLYLHHCHDGRAFLRGFVWRRRQENRDAGKPDWMPRPPMLVSPGLLQRKRPISWAHHTAIIGIGYDSGCRHCVAVLVTATSSTIRCLHGTGCVAVN